MFTYSDKCLDQSDESLVLLDKQHRSDPDFQAVGQALVEDTQHCPYRQGQSQQKTYSYSCRCYYEYHVRPILELSDT